MPRTLKPTGPEEQTLCCQRCGAELKAPEAYEHGGEVLCADCCLERRADRSRKTHWQYLGAIKTEYLREPED